jgi:hypothetical protein
MAASARAGYPEIVANCRSFEVNRSALSLALILALPGVAQADLRPDPVGVTGPYGLVYLPVLVAAVSGNYFYRRRRK